MQLFCVVRTTGFEAFPKLLHCYYLSSDLWEFKVMRELGMRGSEPEFRDYSQHS